MVPEELPAMFHKTSSHAVAGFDVVALIRKLSIIQILVRNVLLLDTHAHVQCLIKKVKAGYLLRCLQSRRIFIS